MIKSKLSTACEDWINSDEDRIGLDELNEDWINSDEDRIGLDELNEDWIDLMILLFIFESIQKWLETLWFVWNDSDNQLWLLNQFKNS